MARTSADKSIPPPLRALGGWSHADWFDVSILDGDEVVGISLPRLPGLRKQNFELAERSVRELPRGKATGRKATAAADRVPSGIAEILESVGIVRAVAFRRPRFFFSAAPTLFFAEIPATNLKVRSADALRQNLIANALRGCVLACRKGGITVMFWPADEAEVTAFVRAAGPLHPPHAQFDLADEARRASGSARRQGREDRAEHERLLAELDGLRSKVAELQPKQSVHGALETLGLDDARLKAMLLLLHPDKHGNSAAANEAAKWVNGLRDALKASRSG